MHTWRSPNDSGSVWRVISDGGGRLCSFEVATVRLVSWDWLVSPEWQSSARPAPWGCSDTVSSLSPPNGRNRHRRNVHRSDGRCCRGCQTLANVAVYDITSDANGMYGCTTTPEPTFEAPSPARTESDFLERRANRRVARLTTTGPRGGPGSTVPRRIWRPASVPGDLRRIRLPFDPPVQPFVPAGEGFSRLC